MFQEPLTQCPILDSDWNSPKGVPLSAIIFGGRRSNTVPLVRQALHWQHGVFLGASMSSETTAAATGVVGELRHDPFAMLPFCGYNMADYFTHWLSMETSDRKMPGIFYVNWFRKGANHEFLWPGFGENIRVLKWMFERMEGTVDAVQSQIGYLPKRSSLDLSGLSLSSDAIEALLRIVPSEWQKESQALEEYFAIFGEKLPIALRKEVEFLKKGVECCDDGSS